MRAVRKAYLFELDFHIYACDQASSTQKIEVWIFHQYIWRSLETYAPHRSLNVWTTVQVFILFLIQNYLET